MQCIDSYGKALRQRQFRHQTRNEIVGVGIKDKRRQPVWIERIPIIGPVGMEVVREVRPTDEAKRDPLRVTGCGPDEHDGNSDGAPAELEHMEFLLSCSTWSARG